MLGPKSRALTRALKIFDFGPKQKKSKIQDAVTIRPALQRIPLKTRTHTKRTHTSTKIHRAQYRALYFSKVHPGHCACLRRFKQSNMLPPWAETNVTYPSLDNFDFNKVYCYLVFVHRPQCIPKFLFQSTQVLEKHHLSYLFSGIWNPAKPNPTSAI